jgi:O-antigen/teichoic acid export membrane protein
MVHARRLASGIWWNLTAFASVAAIAFFLSPFVVHHLGNAAYGVWVVVNTMISYMGLLDLGLRGAVTRFTSNYHAQGLHDAASRSVSAAFSFRCGVAAVVLAITVALGALTGRIFHIPPELQSAARYAILTSGLSLGIGLLIGVYGGVLAALHRFDLLSGLNVLQTAASALGIVFLLRAGHGVVAMALWQLVCVVGFGTMQVVAVRRVYPELKLVAGLPPRDELRKLWAYSALVFVINVGAQVIYSTDNLVIGAFLPIGVVTFYAIGGSLIDYVKQIAAAIATTFMPLASRLSASSDPDHLRRLLIDGTRAVLLIVLPFELGLLVRGETFITLWMGPQYGPISGRVLMLLLVGAIFATANHTSVNMAFGLSKHKPVAIWTAAEAVANLTLSIILVRRIGIYGVAWGTAIPNLIVHVLLWPRYITRIADVPLGTYLVQSWLRCAAAAAPFAGACYLTDRYWPAPNLLVFLGQMAALMPVYVAGVAVFFHAQIAEGVRMWKSREHKPNAEAASTLGAQT